MSLQRLAVLSLAVAWTLALAPPAPASGQAKRHHHPKRHHKGVYGIRGSGSGGSASGSGGTTGTGSAARKECGIAGVTLVSVGAGTAAFVCPGHNASAAVEITSPPYVPPAENSGRVEFGNPGITMSQLTTLSTSYELTLGSCSGGSPRFEIRLEPPGVRYSWDAAYVLYVYLGPSPNYENCPRGIWQSSGNLAAPGALIDDSNLPGGSHNDTFANAASRYGSWTIDDIWLGMDGGWAAGQAGIFEGTHINSAAY